MNDYEHGPITEAADVMFLGAGFSRAVTHGKAPLMKDFFSELDDRRYWDLSKFLCECFGNSKQANVEEAMLRLDQLATSPFTDAIDPFIDQCRKRERIVRRELDSYILDRLKGLSPVGGKAADIVFNCSDRATIITTNYDNLAECILSRRPGLRHSVPDSNCHHCRLCHVLNDGCDCSGPKPRDNLNDWQGTLLKLHGSIAWRVCQSGACEKSLCITPDPACRAFKDERCECCGGPCSPVIVHPSMVKQFSAFPQLCRMWDAAYLSLREARRILFFGFSVPRSDAVICEMFRCTLGRSNVIETIVVIDVEPDAPILRLKEILPNAPKIKFQGSPSPQN